MRMPAVLSWFDYSVKPLKTEFNMTSGRKRKVKIVLRNRPIRDRNKLVTKHASLPVLFISVRIKIAHTCKSRERMK